jgi:hypothetical protein
LGLCLKRYISPKNNVHPVSAIALSPVNGRRSRLCTVSADLI